MVKYTGRHSTSLKANTNLLSKWLRIEGDGSLLNINLPISIYPKTLCGHFLSYNNVYHVVLFGIGFTEGIIKIISEKYFQDQITGP